VRLLLALSALLSISEEAALEGWMQQAFYPVLLSILVLASLGVPIPEDVPLIVSGVLLRTHPGIASWPGMLLVALVGVMIGDLVLYTLGRRWGRDVASHRSVSWLITPKRFAWATGEFHRYGMWFCFFGRFMMGVRAAMCLTAGATHFPYWRFFLADFTAALLSVPLLTYLGYWFAGMIPTLQEYLTAAQAVLWGGGALAILVLMLLYRRRRRRRHLLLQAARARAAGDRVAPGSPSDPARRPPGATTNELAQEP
jgi:membrane protein DedA with SNARE-associated domain